MSRRDTDRNPLLLDTRAADRVRVLQRYWTHIRVADWLAGRRDGRRGLPEREETTQWQHRVAAQSREGCQSVRRMVDRHSAPLVKQLYGLQAELEQADEDLEDLTERLGAIPAEPSAEALAVRGPAEAQDPEAVIAARARRRHAATREAARAAQRAAVQRRRALAVQADQVRADLDALHALGCTQAHRIVEHHQRRTHVYLRALIRRHPDRSRVVDLFDRHPLTPPAWATRPSPWTTERHPLPGPDRHLSLA
ncbi:hypothetical protein ACI8AA_01445 [Geodermatophilus sp. SYSU D01180]